MSTQRRKIVARLLKIGYVPKASRTKKYLTFEHPEQERDLFVGKAGAMRSGKSSSRSFAVMESTRLRVMQAGERHLEEMGPDFAERVDRALTGAV